MQTAMKLKTTVLPGRRIEVDAPDLPEGTPVELIVLSDTTEKSAEAKAPRLWDWLQSLPKSSLTPADWERIEAEMRREKAAWGD